MVETSRNKVAARLDSRPAFLSLDVDFVDAAFCPGTGTPEVAAPTSMQAMQYLRALREIPFVGYDVVEVEPPAIMDAAREWFRSGITELKLTLDDVVRADGPSQPVQGTAGAPRSGLPHCVRRCQASRYRRRSQRGRAPNDPTP